LQQYEIIYFHLEYVLVLLFLSTFPFITECRPVAYRGGVWGVQTPSPEVAKALQNRAKLKPIVKTVKNCWI